MTFRKIIKVICFAVVTMAIMYVCCVFGYLQGYTDGSNAPVDANLNVTVLESIRSGDYPMAIKLLDTHLDGSIIYHWTLKNRGKSLFDVIGFGQFDKSFMEHVATYRKHQPLDYSNKDMNSAIASVLHQYSTNKKSRIQSKPNKADTPDTKAVR